MSHARRAALLLAALAMVGTACHNGGKKTTATTTLSGPRESATLQVRPVLGIAGDCGAIPDNPPAAEPVQVLFQTQCVSLGPAGLVITKAGVEPLTNPQGASYVRITLADGDVKRFADFSQEHLHNKVALVAFGRVLTTPTLEVPITDGKFDATNVSRNDGLRLKAALA